MPHFSTPFSPPANRDRQEESIMATEKLTIIKADVKNEVTKKVKPKFVQLGNMNFTATVEVDKSAAKELDTDARFVAKLYDDATKEYKKLVNECSLCVSKANDLGSVMPLSDKELKELDADIQKIFAKYQKSIEQVTNKHFDKWKQANKDRKKYRIKVVGAIVLGSAAAIGSTASLAAGAVTGGVSIAASIYGIAQSIVSVARAVQKVTSDIVKVHGQLEKALKELVNRRIDNDLDHRNLNMDVPWLKGILPSTENLVVQIWERLALAIPAPAELDRVVLWETPRNRVEYCGGS